MFTIEWLGSGVPPVTLAQTQRNWLETAFTVNHKPIYSIANLLEADYARRINTGDNRRNIVAFTVMRGVNTTQAEFADAEEAAVFMIDHPPSLASTGILKVFIKGAVTNQTRFFLDAQLDTAEPVGEIGVAMSFRYVFNCGRASNNSV